MKKVFLILKSCLLQLSKRVMVYWLIAALILLVFADSRKAKIRRLDSLSPWALYPTMFSLGQSHFNKNDFRFAIRYYQILSEVFPDLSRAYAMMGYCHYQIGEEKEATRLYKKALKMRPQFFWYRFNLAVIYYNMKNYEQSLIHAEQVANLNFDQMKRAVLFRKFDHLDPVLKNELNKSAVKYLSSIYVLNRKLCVLNYEFLGEYRSVLDISLASIRDQHLKGELFFYYYAGIASYQLGQYGDALKFLSHVIRLKPRGRSTFYYLALSQKAIKESQGQTVSQKQLQFIENFDEKFLENERKSMTFDVVFHPWAFYFPIGQEGIKQ